VEAGREVGGVASIMFGFLQASYVPRAGRMGWGSSSQSSLGWRYAPS